jgi:DNA-damage-inducible protein J
MAKEATLQVRMDAELKEQVEDLYRRMGSSFAEAVRIFARQSVEENAMPFTMHLTKKSGKRILGIADGKYNFPDDIDGSNQEIADMFGVNE